MSEHKAARRMAAQPQARGTLGDTPSPYRMSVRAANDRSRGAVSPRPASCSKAFVQRVARGARRWRRHCPALPGPRGGLREAKRVRACSNIGHACGQGADLEQAVGEGQTRRAVVEDGDGGDVRDHAVLDEDPRHRRRFPGQEDRILRDRVGLGHGARRNAQGRIAGGRAHRREGASGLAGHRPRSAGRTRWSRPFHDYAQRWLAGVGDTGEAALAADGLVHPRRHQGEDG